MSPTSLTHDVSLSEDATRQVVMTGDRPTGPLHLGHYVGSLQSRLQLQSRHEQIILIADLQALTDNAGRAANVRENVLEVALDYLAVGIDPMASTIAVQSGIPELAELTVLYLNLVTIGHLQRNPTIKSEIQLRGFENHLPAGFFCYPVSQAADITGFRGTLVPVGEDQLPMIEQSNDIVRKVNSLAGRPILPEARALLSSTPRLPGVDGRKASKSLGNAISLSDSPAVISSKVQEMFTDPGHLRVADPGKVEGNVVFAYLEAFDPDQAALEDLKAHYRRGGLGDMVLKRRLEGILQDLLAPIRTRRQELEPEREEVARILREGTLKARERAAEVCREVKAAFAIPAL